MNVLDLLDSHLVDCGFQVSRVARGLGGVLDPVGATSEGFVRMEAPSGALRLAENAENLDHI